MSRVTEIIEQHIKNLDQSDRTFLLSFSDPVLRKFLSPNSRKRASKFIKIGLLTKGHSPEGKANVIYYVDSYVLSRL